MNEVDSGTFTYSLTTSLNGQEERAALYTEYSNQLSQGRPKGLQVQQAEEERNLSTSDTLLDARSPTDGLYGHNITALHKFETAERLLKQIQVKSVDV